MSTTMTHYVMYGVKFNTKNYNIPESFLDEVDPSPIKIIFTDPMNDCNEAIAGFIITETDEFDGMDLIEITSNFLDKKKNLLEEQLKKLEFLDKLSFNPKLYIFTQYK